MTISGENADDFNMGIEHKKKCSHLPYVPFKNSFWNYPGEAFEKCCRNPS